MSKEKLGVGFIGAGAVTQAIHLPTLARLIDLFEVRQVYDVVADVATGVAARSGSIVEFAGECAHRSGRGCRGDLQPATSSSPSAPDPPPPGPHPIGQHLHPPDRPANLDQSMPLGLSNGGPRRCPSNPPTNIKEHKP